VPGANQYKAQEFIDAIPGTGGIVTTIAKRVGCAWHTAAKYIERYATVKEAYQCELEKNLDVAEAIIIDNLKLLRQEQERKYKVVDTADARWLLATKGKDRGYSQKSEMEVTGKDGAPLRVEYVNDWRSAASLPAPWAADGQDAGEEVQLASSGETLEEDNAGHGDSG